MPNSPPVLPYALAYHRRKWTLVKIAHKQKSPLEGGWNTRTWADAQVHAEFSGQCNIGVILGEASDWLADVDLDCPEAMDLAPEFLPPTLTFGRDGARRSHWLYRSVGAATEKYTLPSPDGKPETIVELRAQNASGPSHQTVFPGSTYKDGSPIEFDDGKGPGAEVQSILAAALANVVRQLAVAVTQVRLGTARSDAIAIAKRGDFRALDKRQSPPARGPAKADSALATAVAKYNADHPRTYPPGGSGTCPICAHHGCWGQSVRGAGYWSCFSASHQEGGVRAGDVWTGDALDLAAHAAKLAPREYLRREKYHVEESAAALERDDKGVPVPSLRNVAAVLEHERSALHYDTFLSQLRCNGRQWTDADDRALADRLQSMVGLKRVPLQIVAQGAETYAERHSRNCVVEFLEGLAWDGQPRIEECFARAFGAADNEYTRAVSRNFWRALVARPLQPGCQSDSMVVLEGEQGIRKSSACRIIAGEWFADTDQMPGNKDFCIMLQGHLLVELGEMHAFSRAEVTAVKTAVSRRVDTYRAPFGRRAKDHPRQGSLIGTTNQFEWAQDPTGNRRFWPVRCAAIDLEWLTANRSQLFAEAVRDVKAGLPWHVVPQEEAVAEQEARYQLDPWEDAIRDWLARNAKTQVTTIGLIQLACNKEVGTTSSGDARRVAAIMRRLGWEAKKAESGGRYWLPRSHVGSNVDVGSHNPLY